MSCQDRLWWADKEALRICEIRFNPNLFSFLGNWWDLFYKLFALTIKRFGEGERAVGGCNL